MTITLIFCTKKREETKAQKIIEEERKDEIFHDFRFIDT